MANIRKPNIPCFFLLSGLRIMLKTSAKYTIGISGAISPTLAAMIHEGNALLVVLNSARLIR